MGETGLIIRQNIQPAPNHRLSPSVRADCPVQREHFQAFGDDGGSEWTEVAATRVDVTD